MTGYQPAPKQMLSNSLCSFLEEDMPDEVEE
ncbi:uncharacterized protein METZ01_LOCUS321402 [marine metagenome]|uniref:Uncharacterized protein n=1 Tax=marine metagenome TaxID=408172 RepID=A0A382P744_9ZZZZ